MPQLSHELLYHLTRKHNSYLRHNIHTTLTSDPFSATNIPNAGAWGFLTPKATSLQPSTEKNATPQQIVVMKKTNKRRVTKKGKKNNTKMPGSSLTRKIVESRRLTGSKCKFVTARGIKLHQAALRAAHLRKQA